MDFSFLTYLSGVSKIALVLLFVLFILLILEIFYFRQRRKPTPPPPPTAVSPPSSEVILPPAPAGTPPPPVANLVSQAPTSRSSKRALLIIAGIVLLLLTLPAALLLVKQRQEVRKKAECVKPGTPTYIGASREDRARPTEVCVFDTLKYKITVQWTDNSNNEDSFIISRQHGSETREFTVASDSQVGLGKVYYYTDEIYACGTGGGKCISGPQDFSYSVQAVSADCRSDPSATASRRVNCFDSQSLSAWGGCDEIQLNWDTDGDVTAYDIYRDGILYASNVNFSLCDGTGWHDDSPKMPPTTTHSYYLKAYLKCGPTQNTKTVTATTDPSLCAQVTPTPTKVPTPTPTSPPTLTCQSLAMYDQNWQEITDYATLKVDQKVYFAVKGSPETAIIKAKFNINGVIQETTTKRPEGYYIEYLIPAGGNYKVEAWVCDSRGQCS